MITFEGVKKVKTITQPLHNRNTPGAMGELIKAQTHEYELRKGQSDVNVFTKTRFTKNSAKTDIFVATGEEGQFLNNFVRAKMFLLTFKIKNNIQPDKVKSLEDRIFSTITKAQDFILKHGAKD